MRAFLAVSACHNLALIDTYTKKLFLREQAEHGIPPLQMIVLLFNISALLSSPDFEYRLAHEIITIPHHFSSYNIAFQIFSIFEKQIAGHFGQPAIC